MSYDFYEDELFEKIEEILKGEDKIEESTLTNFGKDQFYKIVEMLTEELEKMSRDINNLSKRVEYLKEKLKKVLSYKGEYKPIEKERNVGKRPSRGLATPKEEYYIPILESLYELGGRGTIGEVLDRVGEKMKYVLNEYDYEFLQSGNIRWRNRAQWTRLELVHQGLLKNNSPNGVWELSEKGYKFLMEKKKSGS
ncbi:winged helix-turn-helix domain-containing protein [Dictyoglomus thermophilum]|uniref:Restriction system protein Mrr-like N-terminal domain-containing protein n=1 Tax=Dictyoglomus thermophilum (strain ATCC 35947 / DSM 3960 / H-6-12) TaxID=309799 RepID=B5YBC5_DICT6|nr:winged helix-turn-helix domain-containing protein [Dictyoglomus thermophilum]ACI18507.1 hypothetical protein DICTH_0106 [Dictyoglomus thermophilum H-6-12]TYT21055.1 hypothetical protein FY122_08675 [Dictyoglomus thermophilum]